MSIFTDSWHAHHLSNEIMVHLHKLIRKFTRSLPRITQNCTCPLFNSILAAASLVIGKIGKRKQSKEFMCVCCELGGLLCTTFLSIICFTRKASAWVNIFCTLTHLMRALFTGKDPAQKLVVFFYGHLSCPLWGSRIQFYYRYKSKKMEMHFFTLDTIFFIWWQQHHCLLVPFYVTFLHWEKKENLSKLASSE